MDEPVSDETVPRDQPVAGSPTSEFSRLLTGLNDMVAEFQRDSTPENFARIVSALGAFGLSAIEVWREGADYARRHPVRLAAGAGLLFFAIRGLIVPNSRVRSQRDMTFH